MDCNGCERRVRHAGHDMRGVKSVDVNRKQSKVSVMGYVDSAKVLNKVRSTGKKAKMWPYVEHNFVARRQAYDKKAPSGEVGNVVQAVPTPNATNQMLIGLFSDKNPHTCIVM